MELALNIQIAVPFCTFQKIKTKLANIFKLPVAKTGHCPAALQTRWGRDLNKSHQPHIPDFHKSRLSYRTVATSTGRRGRRSGSRGRGRRSLASWWRRRGSGLRLLLLLSSSGLLVILVVCHIVLVPTISSVGVSTLSVVLSILGGVVSHAGSTGTGTSRTGRTGRCTWGWGLRLLLLVIVTTVVVTAATVSSPTASIAAAAALVAVTTIATVVVLWRVILEVLVLLLDVIQEIYAKFFSSLDIICIRSTRILN